MTGENAAPAEMPGELPPVWCARHTDGSISVSEEEWRADMWRGHGLEVVVMVPEARALAAEAALAARPMTDAPTDGTEIMVWGRENQVPADRLRWLVARYSRGWWTTTHPSMTVKALAWLPLPPDHAAAIRAQGE